jgi:two-component system NtrC family sensor kinase
MTSVRLRLLIIALAPLIVLMPMLLLIGMTRWTADYDKVLIANVESDLKIASQYLSRLLAKTGDELGAVTESVEFNTWLDRPAADLERYLKDTQVRLGLNFLYYLPAEQARQAGNDWPVIAQAASGQGGAQIDVMANDTLAALSDRLAQAAEIPIIATPAAVPTTRAVEDRGMVIHAASPISLNGHRGVLVGGILLNRNLDFIDTINDLVYSHAGAVGARQGTATLFLDDVRISTNVRLFEDVRALGTRVSAEVRAGVLTEGRTWLDRAFVVNDWYISGYLPITDSFGDRVGMLYVGFLEAPFKLAKRDAFLWMMAAFAAVLLLSAPVFLWMARGIFTPLERMTQVMKHVGQGDLTARIGPVGARGEIGEVAQHLDWLLEQIQDRDRRLRAWNEELNQRVGQRTAELSEANAKLEQTFRQLVMSEKLASIGEITAGVAHEINNPVAVILGNVDVIRQTLGDGAAPVQTELSLIDKQVSRIEAIVGKLLKFAVDCRFDPVPLVRVDTGEIQQVIVNLVVNAVQAMGTGGQLDLLLRPEQRDGAAGVALSVRDSGPGVPEGQLSSVFDPFFTTKRGEGTGLGLSISQTLIQRAGGLITVSNRDAQGAEFTVWLPAE